MEQDLAIREGVAEDYPAVLDIQRRAYREKEAPLYGENLPPLFETPETLAEELAAGKRLLVGVYDGRIAASLRMKTLEDGSVYFGRLSVDPDLQGKGIGKRMALAVEDWHPEAAVFVLDCGEKSEENRHIYGKIGYRETGEVVEVEYGPRCVVMKKRRNI
ncbi:MAG: GNAT family N-acetyltransferase [Planctomycetota bacterium]|jgi:GNAT superfamily N-acetyltransferase|nr:GNAT family N-acetyltransferase [Planctomycetota bacterium]